jgi:hypothetical protein
MLGSDILALPTLPAYGTMFYNIAKLYTLENEDLIDDIAGDMNFLVDGKDNSGKPYIPDTIISRGPDSRLLLSTGNVDIKSRINIFVQKHIPNWLPKIRTYAKPTTSLVKRSTTPNNQHPNNQPPNKQPTPNTV